MLAKALVFAPLAALALAVLLVVAFGRRTFAGRVAAAVLTALWVLALARMLGAPALLAGGLAASALYLLRRTWAARSTG